MRRGRTRTALLRRYVGREYVGSFIVSFFFFFFIFFVNQILVLAQKVLLKNVSISDVLTLVVLSIPQFLMYTMPFSSLAAASMVIGNLSSGNEILAMRSSGIHSAKIFRPIIVLSAVVACLTMVIADKMIPYTAQQYRELYAEIIQKMPTLELDSYSSTQFANRVISNGLVEGNTIYDVLILDDTDTTDSRVISAKEASISVVDMERFLYKIELKNPQILITDSSSLKSYSLAGAEEMVLYLDLSSNASGYSSITPSQMSIAELLEGIAEKEEEQRFLVRQNEITVSATAENLATKLVALENGISVSPGELVTVNTQALRLNRLKHNQAFSFYYQYYKSELQKKFALSLACICLVFVAFPMSFFRVKYGRLFGFGLSMFVACIYWFFLYFMHTKAISVALDPMYLLHLPNVVVFLIGIILLIRMRKK